MSNRFLVASLLLFPIAFMGCAKRDGAVQSLRELVSQLEVATSNDLERSSVISVAVDLSGIIVFASPHAVDGRQRELAAAVGEKAAKELWNKTGLSESFYIFFVPSNGAIKSLRWEKPLFVFNDLFMVSCQPGNRLSFNIDNKSLRGIKVEHQ